MMINKDPIYQQLHDILKDLILSEQYSPGDKFMTERTICEHYDVSRATANKALSNLVSEGFLKFKKGVGTFVQEKPADEGPVKSLTSFTENALSSGMQPSTQVLHFERLHSSKVDPQIREGLMLKEDEDLYRIKRLRRADGVPMILEERYIITRYCPDLFEHSLKGSLYSIFVNKYSLIIESTDERIKAIILDDEIADILEVESGQAGFLVRAIGYMENHKPLWWERTFHRSDGFEFRCRVNSIHNFQKFETCVLPREEDYEAESG